MNENNNEIYLNNPDYDILTEQLFNMPENHHVLKDLYEIKSRVYHCSNERLNAYFKDLKLDGATVATVGSSGDQVLNAIFYGATDITLIDANIFIRAYFEYKTAMIKNLSFNEFSELIGSFKMFNWKTYSLISHDLSKNTKQFFDELMLNQDDNGHDYDEGFLTDSLIRNNLFHTPCENYNEECENLFYNNESAYNELKKKLISKNFNIEFIVADLNDFPKHLTKEYDYIFLSNICQYVNIVDMFPIIKQLYKKIKVGGAIQYQYTYGSNPEKEPNFKNLTLIKKLISKDVLANTHHVYFLEKPAKQKNAELSI